MHRLIEEHLEEVLSGAGLPASHPAREHLEVCVDCRSEVDAMTECSLLLHQLRAPAEVELRPGFYARVRERIEAQAPVSIWDLFATSLMGRGLAAASLALMLTMSAYLFSSETPAAQPFAERSVMQETYPMLPASDFPDEVLAVPDVTRLAAADTNRAAVLMNLVTYQGR